MKFVIAPDSFKESMDALTAAMSIRDGLKAVFGDAQYRLYPMADGGEGTLSAIHYYTNDAIIKYETVLGPKQATVHAKMIHMPSKQEVYIEMAEAAGMMLLKSDERNPLITSTYGVGELVLKAVSLFPKRIVVALGGSVTNDGGMGFLKALGLRFMDEDGHEVKEGGGNLHRIHHIENIEAMKRFDDIEFYVLTDVTNPLLGQSGATHTFSKQKGANPHMITMMEEGMKHFADVIEHAFNQVMRYEKGSGAAGGLGFALQFLPHVKTLSGIDYLLNLSGMEKDIEDCDVVFIGEGSLDDQSLQGKVPVGVARLAKKYHKPVIAFVGVLKCEPHKLIPYGIDDVYVINEETGSLETMLMTAPKNIRLTAEKVAGILKEKMLI